MRCWFMIFLQKTQKNSYTKTIQSGRLSFASMFPSKNFFNKCPWLIPKHINGLNKLGK